MVGSAHKMCSINLILMASRDHVVYASSQWETTLHCNVISHWIGAYAKWSQGIQFCNHITHDNAYLNHWCIATSDLDDYHTQNYLWDGWMIISCRIWWVVITYPSHWQLWNCVQERRISSMDNQLHFREWSVCCNYSSMLYMYSFGSNAECFQWTIVPYTQTGMVCVLAVYSQVPL